MLVSRARLTNVWARGITVTGMVCDESWNCTRQVGNSPNGFDWTRTSLDLGVEDAGMFSLVDGGPGLIGTGAWSDQLGDVSVSLFWTSSDGVTWEVLEGDPEVFAGGAGINAFAWLDDRLIGLGGSPVDNAPAVWIRTP